MDNPDSSTSALAFVLSQQKNASIVYTSSDCWGDIYVIDSYNHRLLSFDSIYEQSRMDKHSVVSPVHEYTRAMLCAMLFVPAERVLLLGLGSGSLLRAIHHVNPTIYIDAIELRDDVVTIARQYFSIPEHPKVNIRVQDASQAIEAREDASCDIIFSDLYLAFDMDPLQKHVVLLEESYRALSDRGCLVINFHQVPHAQSSFMIKLNHLYAHMLMCKVPNGNYVIYAFKKALSLPFCQYLDDFKQFEELFNVNFSSLTARFREFTA